jgi:PPOX class probable F420-dependent enzyme
VITAEDGLRVVAELAAAERWLAVLVTKRPNGEPGVSLVNAGILAHPVTGETVIAFVSRGKTAKLTNLRKNPKATLVFRSGWEWISVTGPVELAGPDDQLAGLGDEELRLLLRDIYVAAGGNHPDLDDYDRVMREDRRTAVLLTPARFTSNPPGTDHEEPDHD